jgi:hypothetical protein
MPKLAGGGSLPYSRHFVPIQRQLPAFPLPKMPDAAPFSRVPAVHSGGKIANLVFLL